MHTPGPCPVAAGVMLAHKMKDCEFIYKHGCSPYALGWIDGSITHYRVVK